MQLWLLLVERTNVSSMGFVVLLPYSFLELKAPLYIGGSQGSSSIVLSLGSVFLSSFFCVFSA